MTIAIAVPITGSNKAVLKIDRSNVPTIVRRDRNHGPLKILGRKCQNLKNQRAEKTDLRHHQIQIKAAATTTPIATVTIGNLKEEVPKKTSVC